MTITLNHFSAAAVFALFASIVFGITHRETTRDMVRYGTLLLRDVSRRSAGGRLGHVDVEKVVPGFGLSAFGLDQNTSAASHDQAKRLRANSQRPSSLPHKRIEHSLRLKIQTPIERDRSRIRFGHRQRQQ